MIKIFKKSELSPEEIMSRGISAADISAVVAEIIANVRKNGDKALKEYCEKHKCTYHAPYTSSGKDNKKTFTVEVYVNGKSRGVGQGASIYKAENEACRKALLSLGEAKG